MLDAKHAAVHADAPLLEGQAAPTHAQRVQHAIDRIKRLLGKDFPVLPRVSARALSPTNSTRRWPTRTALTVDDPWRITGWLTQLARVREGAESFRGRPVRA